MKLRELIETVKSEKHTAYNEAKIIDFVNEIEADVAKQLAVDIPVYADNHTDLDKELLAPAPYDVLYVSYVKSKVDYSNEEYASYQLNVEQFQQDFAEFINYIVREGVAANKDRWPRIFRHTF